MCSVRSAWLSQLRKIQPKVSTSCSRTKWQNGFKVTLFLHINPTMYPTHSVLFHCLFHIVQIAHCYSHMSLTELYFRVQCCHPKCRFTKTGLTFCHSGFTIQRCEEEGGFKTNVLINLFLQYKYWAFLALAVFVMLLGLCGCLCLRK